jgi:hypothetical protein
VQSGAMKRAPRAFKERVSDREVESAVLSHEQGTSSFQREGLGP